MNNSSDPLPRCPFGARPTWRKTATLGLGTRFHIGCDCGRETDLHPSPDAARREWERGVTESQEQAA